MSFSFSSSRMDEKEKQQALEEEQARLQALKVGHVLFLINYIYKDYTIHAYPNSI